VQTIRFALGTGTASSATSIPNNAIVIRAVVDVTTAYSAGANITLGSAASPLVLANAGVANPQQVDVYSTGDLDVTWAGPAVVQATVTGAPAAGAAEILVYYVVTPQA
jgi:hypothetical protein